MHDSTPRRLSFFSLIVLCWVGLAAAGCEFHVSTARISEAVTATDAQGRQPTSSFSPTDVFFVAGELANAPSGTTVGATWIAVEVDAAGVAPNLVLDSTELEGASGPFHFQLSNDSPWPSGRYRVELALDGEQERTLDFLVAAQAASNQTGVPIQTSPPNQTSPAPSPAPRQSATESRTQEASPDTVIASRGAHVFRQAHLDQGLEMIHFLSGELATEGEGERLPQDALRQFEEDPAQFAEGMAFIDQVLTAARSTTDIAEIAGYRMVLFNTLYTLNQQLPAAERPALLEIVFAKNPVLAYDPATQLTLTSRDLRGAAEIYAFGAAIPVSGAEVARYADELGRTLAPAFPNLGLEEKQFLATAGVLWEVLQSNLATFSPQQVATLRRNFAAPTNQPPTTGSGGGTMDADTARFLSQLSFQQHVSTLNVIENIGGTGNYWEVVPAW